MSKETYTLGFNNKNEEKRRSKIESAFEDLTKKLPKRQSTFFENPAYQNTENNFGTGYNEVSDASLDEEFNTISEAAKKDRIQKFLEEINAQRLLVEKMNLVAENDAREEIAQEELEAFSEGEIEGTFGVAKYKEEEGVEYEKRGSGKQDVDKKARFINITKKARSGEGDELTAQDLLFFDRNLDYFLSRFEKKPEKYEAEIDFLQGVKEEKELARERAGKAKKPKFAQAQDSIRLNKNKQEEAKELLRLQQLEKGGRFKRRGYEEGEGFTYEAPQYNKGNEKFYEAVNQDHIGGIEGRIRRIDTISTLGEEESRYAGPQDAIGYRSYDMTQTSQPTKPRKPPRAKQEATRLSHESSTKDKLIAFVKTKRNIDLGEQSDLSIDDINWALANFDSLEKAARNFVEQEEGYYDLGDEDRGIGQRDYYDLGDEDNNITQQEKAKLVSEIREVLGGRNKDATQETAQETTLYSSIAAGPSEDENRFLDLLRRKMRKTRLAERDEKWFNRNFDRIAPAILDRNRLSFEKTSFDNPNYGAFENPLFEQELRYLKKLAQERKNFDDIVFDLNDQKDELQLASFVAYLKNEQSEYEGRWVEENLEMLFEKARVFINSHQVENDVYMLLDDVTSNKDGLVVSLKAELRFDDELGIRDSVKFRKLVAILKVLLLLLAYFC